MKNHDEMSGEFFLNTASSSLRTMASKHIQQLTFNSWPIDQTVFGLISEHIFNKSVLWYI